MSGKSTPLVTIVTPVLNRADTIGRTLTSVAGQHYPELEHVVVDGGSTDGTLEIVREFAARFPHVSWLSERDTGMYDAVNKGLTKARGEVLAYLNSDDYYLPWSVGSAVGALGDADIVYGDLGVAVRTGTTSTFYAQFYRDFDLRHYTYRATLAQPTVFWRRDVQSRTGLFDDSYRLLGDCEYWLRAATTGARFRHVDELLAVQVEHGGTLRATRPSELRAEFDRLRSAYATAAGPKGSDLRAAITRRAQWRARQVQLLWLSLAGGAKRWPEFLRFLTQTGVSVRPTYLLSHALPPALRPPTSLLDATRFESCVFAKLADIGATRV